MRKMMLAVITIIMIFTMGVTTAFAGGHHGRRCYYSACPTQYCTAPGNHYHDGQIYKAHHYGDGHTNYHGGWRH